MINTNRPSQFSDDCNNCLVRNECISATRTTYETRKFIISLRNKPYYSPETREKFRQGIEGHNDYQKDIKTLEEYKLKNFKRDILQHKKVQLKEVKICSPLYRLHGIIDVLSLHYYANNDIDLFIDELKLHYGRKHHFQLATYALILSDPNARIIYEQPMKRKPKNKRLLAYLYPAAIRYINLKGRIFILTSNKEQHYWEMIANNQFFESSGNITMALKKKLSYFRTIMNNKVAELSRVNYCKGCTEKEKTTYCGWRELCSKIPYNPKESQRYYGKNKLLVKTKKVIR